MKNFLPQCGTCGLDIGFPGQQAAWNDDGMFNCTRHHNLYVKETMAAERARILAESKNYVTSKQVFPFRDL